jgi:exocyst complex protein 7
MEKIIFVQEYLKNFQSDDSKAAFDKLKLTWNTGINNIAKNFENLLKSNKYTITLQMFQMVDGKFKIIDSNFNDNILYPFEIEFFKKIHDMIRIINTSNRTSDLGSNNIDFTKIYIENRVNNIVSSIKDFQKLADTRNISSNTLNVIDVPTYKPKSHPFHLFAYVIWYLIKKEVTITSNVFIRDIVLIQGILTLLVPEIFKSFSSTLKAFCIPIFSHTEILLDLDIVEIISDLINDEIFGIPNTIYSELRDCISNQTKMIHKTLEAYLNQISIHDPSSIPISGNVSAIVSNTLLFLNSVLIYRNILDKISFTKPSIISEQLALDKDLSLKLPGEDSKLNNFAIYAIQCMIVNIKLKSKNYHDPVLVQVFLMNNSNWAVTIIESFGLIKVIDQVTYQYLEEITTKSQEAYVKLIWDAAFDLLRFKNPIEPPPKGEKLTRKAKRKVQTKFKVFSAKIDELNQKHQTYCLKSPTLMTSIRNYALGKVTTIYEVFHQKWKDTGFAKVPEHYIFYQPFTLQQLIMNMYSTK